MGKFNEELVKAGVMLAGEGLHPSSKGARVRFSGGKRTVIDGPFTEAKELIAGFWLIQVKSKEEAIEWVKRAPIRRRGGRDRDPPGVRGRGLRRASSRPSCASRRSACAPRRGRAAVAPAAAERWSSRRPTHRAIDAVWRIESARLIAGLARIVRDVGLAEELAQDALVAALEQWPESGVPDNPGAWLMATAQAPRDRPAAPQRDRSSASTRSSGASSRRGRRRPRPDLDAALDDDVGDDLLRLVFTACHPVLSTEARVALTLRLLGGLTTEEIARAFLVPEPTVAQRIVRAKRTLAEAHVPFEVPRGAELAARLSSVLEVIYLIFNEGYSATAGDDWMRPGALRGRAAARPHPGRARARRSPRSTASSR